jgi:hypothetical protein
MKRLGWVLLIVLFAAIAFLVWRWRSAQSSLPPPDPTATSSPSQGATYNPVPSAAAAPAEVVVTPPTSKRERMGKLLDAVNTKAVEFYGKVVDQFGAPLAGVSVTGSVIYNSSAGSGVQEKHTTTDAQGLFSFTGMKGRTFDYHLEKVGYETMPEGDAFDYTELVPEATRHHPDPKNPVVLKMWKLQGAEPLIFFENRELRVPVDGTSLRIDLTTGKRVETGGDLIVTLRHSMAEHGQWLQRYPWQAEIAASGGVVETTSRLMYLAPESGYVPTLTLGEKGDEPEYRGQFDKQLYVKTAGGHFARLKMHVSTQTNPDRPSYVTLSWWLNPKPGSRNLEYAPPPTGLQESRLKPPTSAPTTKP